MILFYANWCEECKRFEPVFEEIYDEALKLNI